MFLGQVDITPAEGGPQIDAALHTIDADSPEDEVMERLLRLQGRRNDPDDLRIIGEAGENVGQGYLSSNGLGNTVTDIWRKATGRRHRLDESDLHHASLRPGPRAH